MVKGAALCNDDGLKKTWQVPAIPAQPDYSKEGVTMAMGQDHQMLFRNPVSY
jgi:hypothetical protein